jgi:hypothetical protein
MDTPQIERCKTHQEQGQAEEVVVVGVAEGKIDKAVLL